MTIDETNALSYNPYLQGGPAEAGYLVIEGAELVLYVNAEYADFDEQMVNPRATQLFDWAGVRMWGSTVKGDALLVLRPGDGEYERSLPREIISILLAADSGS